MKRIIKNIFTIVMAFMLLLICSISAFANNDANKKEYLENHAEILKSIKENTKRTYQTGDVAIDFLYNMLEQDEISKCISENILKCGGNKDIINIAKVIIKNSLEYNEEINKILNSKKDKCVVDKEKESKYIKSHEGILKKLISDLEYERENDSIEKLYLKSMIKQHKTSIKIAKNINKYTDDKDVKNLSKKIEETQHKQIEEMEGILKKIK